MFLLIQLHCNFVWTSNAKYLAQGSHKNDMCIILHLHMELQGLQHLLEFDLPHVV